MGLLCVSVQFQKEGRFSWFLFCFRFLEKWFQQFRFPVPSLHHPVVRGASHVSGTSGTPNRWYFLKSIAGTNGRRIAVQIGGVLQYKLGVYCGFSLSPKPEASEAQRYKWGAHGGTNWRCTASTFSDKLHGLGVPKQSPMFLSLVENAEALSH